MRFEDGSRTQIRQPIDSAGHDVRHFGFDRIFVLKSLDKCPAWAHATREAELWQLFLRDLDRLLCLADVGPEDHVFLPTAHGREAFALRRLIQEIGEERSPVFHLEFRHAVATLDELDSGQQDASVLFYTRVHQAYFNACRAYADTSRIRYYTDTEELARDYGHLVGAEFRVLPIPFRSELIPSRPERENNRAPLKILFLGDVREEKGFQLLPGLGGALHQDYLKTGKVRFIVQAGIHLDEHSKELRDALRKLEVTVLSTSSWLGEWDSSPRTNIMTCSRRRTWFSALIEPAVTGCSSGILAEAIVAGKPTVVQDGTWLAGQQWPGSGETFTDAASLVDAVRSVCERYPQYKEGAGLARERWQRYHTPVQLMNCLIGEDNVPRANAA